MIIGNQNFDCKKHTYVMGILNVTPDSFSDGGKWSAMDRALFHAREMKAQGCDIIDVGGESTRPGFQKISEEEEIERVAPVIETLKREIDLPVSIDTYKAKVAEVALNVGADLVNDIWGLKKDPQMAGVIARHQAACCLMQNRKEASYGQLIAEMKQDLRESIKIALQAGIDREKIILDPGIGFAKSQEENLEVMRSLAEFKELGYPLLLGTSRKSMIGRVLDLPADQREEGTLVTTVMAVEQGYSFVRVHDVLKNKRAIQMTEAIYG